MGRSRLSIIVSMFTLVFALLSACASPPRHINDVCRVFDQKNGWFENWRSEANKAERKYGVPVPVMMATLRKESGFQHNAKPPRTMVLGFIPWKRVSSAYGYSQALDGTWSQYQKETGNRLAKRNNFSDAIDFVGWYHAKTSDQFGVAKTDAYNLYLAYYFGWTGYRRGDWQEKPGLQRYARDTEKMANDYAQQLQECN
ncbi:MAG: transglycosylase SLT domain-containing protein [Rhizobiaceae bacterium]|nr:transglycosylase SLT domain-containing protein [Rhizobiaceae bacterium]